jgi:glycosyltransferase involved in cell wall biosynthesis
MWRWGLTSPYAFEQRSFARALIPYLRSGRFDILHTQDVELAAAVERAGKKGRHPARVILGHGTDEPMAALRRFRYLQHLSPDYRDQAMREIAGETLHFCIPNFVDVHEFKPGASRLRQEWGIPGNAFVIGASGALKRGHKRMDVLVEEVAHLKAKTGAAPWLLLAGASTDETQGIERMAGELLGERCRVLRDLPFEKMVEFYRALDLFVHPAPEEVFGICLLEAMACGIPAVAHDSPTLKWVVGSGGWSVDVRQKEFLAGLWPRILAGDSALRDAARAHVVDLFSWEAVYPAFMQMYQAVLENRLDA